jgi:calcium-dependent protein kinase
MLLRDPGKRYTSEQAIHHIWVKTMAATSKAVLSHKVFENMYAYRSLQKLKKAVLMYIATQTTEKEVGTLRDLFTSLDKDGDGKLSIEDVQETLKSYKGSLNVKEMLESLDTDQSGYIDYSGIFCLTY